MGVLRYFVDVGRRLLGYPLTSERATDALADGLPIPVPIQFTGIVRGGRRSFLHEQWDEALRDNRTTAVLMRNDASLQMLLKERQRAVKQLPWHLECPNEQDLTQAAVR